jgi:DNA-binding MarR family transcriptional regulator
MPSSPTPRNPMSAKADLERLSRTLHSAALHLLRDLRTQDSASGIGPAQLSALSVIVFGGPRSLHELAHAEQVQPPTMSKIVDALVQQGLARREVNTSDRRSITIFPTPKGTQLMKEGRDRREKRLIEMLRRLGQDEIRDLQRASELITRILETE